MALYINSHNIADHEWIWSFLESQRLLGKDLWKKEESFDYNGITYKFQQTVFARQRKNPQHGYAYEMLSSEKLGNGLYGTVYRIACTISLGKMGYFQVKNKHRVAKYQTQEKALREYKYACYTDHLHVKAPNQGYMSMRQIQGQTLSLFLKSYTLTRAERLELTKSLLNAFKAQVVDKNLTHNDLHKDNILIQVHDTPNSRKQFIINMIDYGFATFTPKVGLDQVNGDLVNQTKSGRNGKRLSHTIKEIWNIKESIPEPITRLFHSGSFSLANYISHFNEVVVSPSLETQKPLDSMLTYFKRLEQTHLELAQELRNMLLSAVADSDTNQIDLLKKAVWSCKERLRAEQINIDTPFPYPIFISNPKKKHLFNEIYAYFQSLENKGTQLMGSQKKEGQQLCAVVAHLREKTFNALYVPTSEEHKALIDCGYYCKKLLKENQKLLDIHRNNKYLWAEVGVLLGSLIVLYPLVVGIHYLVTGKLGLFTQTKSAQGAATMEKNFNRLHQMAL